MATDPLIPPPTENSDHGSSSLRFSDEYLTHIRIEAQRDFFTFARTVLGYDNSKIEWKEPPEDPELHKNPDAWIERQVVRKGPDYGISRTGPHKDIVGFLNSGKLWLHLEAPRGSYKTTLTMAWLMWKLLLNRDTRILYMRETSKLARKQLGVMLRLFKKPLLRAAFPDFQVDTKARFDDGFAITGRSPNITDASFEVAGVESDFTGSHYDIILLDDLVNFQNIRTPDGIEKVRETYNMVTPVLDPGGMMIVVGTRYADGDLYGDILREMTVENGGRYHCLILNCGMRLVQDDRKEWTLEGKPRFIFLDKNVLLSKLKSSNHRTFSSQYLNECLSGDMQVFRREQFQSIPWHPWMRDLRYHILTDSAVGELQSNCYSVVALVGIDVADNAYLVDLRVGRWPPPQFPRTICDVFEDWTGRGCKIAQACLESVTLNRTFSSMIEAEMRARGLRFTITPTQRQGRDIGNKMQRMLGMSGRFEQHRFYVVDTVPTWFQDGNATRVLWSPDEYKGENGEKLPGGEMVDQFVRLPASRFVDIPDCLSDMEAKASDGTRICKGSGRQKSPREIARERLQTVNRPHLPRQQQGLGGRWNELHRRINGGLG